MGGVRRVAPSQLERQNQEPAWLGESITETQEFIRSLQGCRLKKIRFEPGVRLQPSYVVLDLKKNGEKPVQTRVFIYDRSGSHRLDGRREPLQKLVCFLQAELRMFKRIEVQEILVSGLQEQPPFDPDSFMTRSVWRAFIYIKLKWRKHTAVLGDLTDDVGTGTCPYQRSSLSPIKEEEIPDIVPDHTASTLLAEDGLCNSPGSCAEPGSCLNERQRLTICRKCFVL